MLLNSAFTKQMLVLQKWRRLECFYSLLETNSLIPNPQFANFLLKFVLDILALGHFYVRMKCGVSKLYKPDRWNRVHAKSDSYWLFLFLYLLDHMAMVYIFQKTAKMTVNAILHILSNSDTDFDLSISNYELT